ncbi:rifin [Plasmodium sp. gorilla clade G1]|nr:rifin [Plasmodium sp. gorilla clade G1]
MKVHYINILLFAVPLNILVNNQRNHNKTILCKSETKPTKTHRTLCECELYASSNYENEQDMKELMENFYRQTSERFREYDERMQDKRKQCKEQCEKDIKKIILKDKIEKELTEKLTALQNDITPEDIPTCVCEKSMADKVEKGCLRCAQNLGGIVAPSTGVLGEITAFAVNAWKTGALLAAEEAAIAEGLAAGKAAGDIAGVSKLIEGLYSKFLLENLFDSPLIEVITTENYFNKTMITEGVKVQYQLSCATDTLGESSGLCFYKSIGEPKATAAVVENAKIVVTDAVEEASEVAFKITASKTAEFKEINIATVKSICNSYNTAIITSIKKENEEKTPIYKIIKTVNMWFHDIKLNLIYCEF